MLNEEIIGDALDRLAREQDRFDKYVGVVAAEALRIVREHEIPATVQARVKSAASLASKLQRYVDDRDPSKRQAIDSPDAVFKVVGDICGVRIATYVESDRQRVVALVEEHFAEVVVEHHDKTSGYRASHCQVSLAAEVLGAPGHANLKDVRGEIQVTSMLAHAWNEIEHAMRYKSVAVAPDDPLETSLLANLLATVHQGNSTIDLLLMARSQRVGQTLVRPISQLLPSAHAFDENAVDVLTVFARLGATDEFGVLRLAGTKDLEADAVVAAGLIDARLHANDEEGLAVRPGTADSLFALLVTRHAREIAALLENQPRGVETERMYRIAQLLLE